jgi:hypothetical protein
MNIVMRTFIFSARLKKIAIGEEELDGLLLDAVRKAIEPGNPSPLDQLPMATNGDRLAGPFIPSPEDWSGCVAAPPEAKRLDLTS